MTRLFALSCYELELRDCSLKDLFVSFSRPRGSQSPESFVCRLGEIQVRGPEDTSWGSPEVSVPFGAGGVLSGPGERGVRGAPGASVAPRRLSLVPLPGGGC